MPAPPPTFGALLRDYRLAAALAGRGSLVLIGGEAGIGKTALAEWALAEALARAPHDGDLHDTITGVNVLRERGLVGERRGAAWGSSAGGIEAHGDMMTRPGTFAAPIVQAGITDFLGLRETSDRYGRYLPDAELGPMANNYAL